MLGVNPGVRGLTLTPEYSTLGHGLMYNVIPGGVAQHRGVAHHCNHWKTEGIFDYLHKE